MVPEGDAGGDVAWKRWQCARMAVMDPRGTICIGIGEKIWVIYTLALIHVLIGHKIRLTRKKKLILSI